MEMRAPASVVESYLDRHEVWFQRCAAPMQVRPLEGNGYVLTLGRFGNFGFEVEPTIGLELLPQDEGIYRILTVPVVDGDPGSSVPVRRGFQCLPAARSGGWDVMSRLTSPARRWID